MRLPSMIVAAVLCAGLAACATSPRNTAAELGLYRSHAGAPVSSFLRTGMLTQWTPLGDAALAVWTSPSRAWLLDVSSCPDLEWAHGISLSDTNGQVSARFDRVQPLGVGRAVPCRIEQIRPLDVRAIREAERMARAGR